MADKLPDDLEFEAASLPPDLEEEAPPAIQGPANPNSYRSLGNDQSAGAEAALAQARKKLAPAKEPENYKPSFGEGALRSFNSGSLKGGVGESMGYQAEKFGFGGLKAGVGKSLKMPDGSVRQLKTEDDVYRAGRDWNEQADDTFRKAHPTTAFLLSSLGDVASDAIVGPKAGNLAYRTLMGGVSGFLGSDADLTDDKRKDNSITRAGGNTVLGGVASAVLPGAITAGAKGVQGIGRGLKDFAEKRAVKVLGRDLDGLINGGKERIHELGRDLLDSKVVRAFTSSSKAGERLQGLEDDRGHLLGGIKGMIDDAAEPGDRLVVDQMADRLENKLVRGAAPSDEGVANLIQKEIDKLRKSVAPVKSYEPGGLDQGLKPHPDSRMSISRAEERLKQPAQDAVNYDKANPGPALEAKKRYASGVRQEIEDNADDIVAKRVPDMAGEFQAAKKAYGLAAEGLGITGKQSRRDMKNNLISPTDYAAGMAGASSAAKEGAEPSLRAAAWALANHLLKGRGESVAAVSMDKIGDLALKLEAVPRVVQKVGGPSSTFAIRYLLRDYPGAFEAVTGTEPPQPDVQR